jgi:acetyl-CoA C-acetyltransferase
MRVAIVGMGFTPLRPLSPEVSYKELVYETAVKAYNECGVNPRKDVDTFVTCAEDYIEGTSIFDEYTPDQLGGALKPNHTLTQDGLQGIIAASLQIMTGNFQIAVVEAHVKSSNILTPDGVALCALDPIYIRPLNLNPYFIAGLEYDRFLRANLIESFECGNVVVKNKRNALRNPYACYGENITIDDYLSSEPVSLPLLSADISQPADGCGVFVLASEKVAESLTKKPIWITGFGWNSGSPNLETRDWVCLSYIEKAAKMAYQMAGIKNPYFELDFAEIDDTFSYKELQHLEALGIISDGNVFARLKEGVFHPEGEFPVNPSGGSLGMGYLYEACGLLRLFVACLQLRKEAGPFQLPKAEKALVHSWRGLPTQSTACVIVSTERR